jgi:hypothetical protein
MPGLVVVPSVAATLSAGYQTIFRPDVRWLPSPDENGAKLGVGVGVGVGQMFVEVITPGVLGSLARCHKDASSLPSLSE